MQAKPINYDKAHDIVKRRMMADIAKMGVADREVFMRGMGSALNEVNSRVEVMDSIGPRLEMNDCSRLHKFIAMKNSPYIIGVVKDDVDALRNVKLDDCQSFVVKHDWARAFEGAEDFDAGDYRLPYEICVFEFRITGTNVLVFLEQQDAIIQVYPMIGNGDFWFMGNNDDPFCQFAMKQIRAICIALEAQVAEHDLIRAPSKLNEKRARQGKAPLNDYHIVSLARRARATKPIETSTTGRRVRLHFRRGHWRHFTTHQTWIKWMLVGDPDLGFIDKEYTL